MPCSIFTSILASIAAPDRRWTLILAALVPLIGLLAFAQPVREIKTDPIEYQHDGVNLQGFLVYDTAAAGKRPGVILFHEWWGNDGYTQKRAEQLAALGYVAFVADMYGKGVSTDDPKEAGKLAGAVMKDRQVMRARAAAALEVLKKSDRVDPKKIAAIGYCFGGTCALELARSGADISGVVSFHGGLSTPNPTDAKNIHAEILVCAGGDDPMVTADQRIAFEKEMRDAGVDWQVNVYGGAVHAFTNPAADSHHMPGIAYNASADHRSWQAMQSFFNEIFQQK